MRIAFIGAGSFVFTRRLVIDLFTFDDLVCDELVLMDIDQGRLETAAALVQKVIAQQDSNMKLTLTTDRRAALKGADYVVAMYEPNGFEARKREVMTTIAHGVPMAVGDTLGPAGIFKGIRTATVAVDIARDMSQLCSTATLLMYANPLAINCWAVKNAADIRTIGLCHGLEYTKGMLGRLLGVPGKEMQVRGAGINHMTWLLDIQHNGRDLYPELWERADEFHDHDPVRFEIMKATGYFATESSYHSAEYVPYFRDRFKSLYIHDRTTPGCNQPMGNWCNQAGELNFIEPSTGPIGRVEPAIPHAWDIYLYERHHHRHAEQQRQEMLTESTVKIERSVEYGMRIIHSEMTGHPRTLSLNVPNDGYISNLPEDAVVELPVQVGSDGLVPAVIGELPEPCASLCRRNIEVQRLVVQGVLNKDPHAIFNALLLDPLTGACLDLPGIRRLFNDLIDVGTGALPNWMAGGKTSARVASFGIKATSPASDRPLRHVEQPEITAVVKP